MVIVQLLSIKITFETEPFNVKPSSSTLQELVLLIGLPELQSPFGPKNCDETAVYC